jgi:penicillin-binding protein 2
VEPITSLEDPLEEPTRNPYAGRVLLFRLIVLALFVALSGRLYWLQMIEGDQYRIRADDNRARQFPIFAPRGVIYDRNSILLVSNEPVYSITVVPADLPSNPRQTLQRLAKLLGMTVEEIEKMLQPAPRGGERITDDFHPVIIKKNVPKTLGDQIEERSADLPGVHLQVQSRREYRDGPLTSHLLGYVGPVNKEQLEKLQSVYPDSRYRQTDDVGQSGLELTQEKWMRGIPGERHLIVNASGREVESLGQTDAKPGKNLRLSIDLTLQREVINILNKYIQEYRSATAIVMDPNNGQILAMVTLPTYDNNVFAKGIESEAFDKLIKDDARPLVNHAISDVYAPGSVFKIIVATGALQEAVVSVSTKVDCPGYIVVPHWLDPTIGTKVPCWDVHGPQDFISGLADSCDTYFYYLGGGSPTGDMEGLGVDRIGKWARAFGLGSPTGIELPGEAGGNIPDDAWKRKAFKEPWYKGDTYNMSIGQGFVTVTPLQMLNAMASIANGGTLYRPQLIMDVLDPLEKDATGRPKVVNPFKPAIIRRLPVSESNMAFVVQGLRAGMMTGRTQEGTIFIGTSNNAEIPGLPMAGKTGTAEYGEPDDKGKMKTHGWFSAFAPYDNPKVVVLVFVDNGGASDASERVEDIIRFYFNLPEQAPQAKPKVETR